MSGARENCDKDWLKAVGLKIKATRTANSLTQEALAEKANLATRTIQKIEAGQITILITTLQRIRAALNCEYDDLIPH